MVFSSIKVFSVLYAALVLVKSHDIPKDFERCHPTDDACVLKRTNDLIRNHPNGYPEILLGSIDPLPLGDIKISGNPDSPVNLNLEMTQLQLHGYKNLTFSKFGGFTNDPKDVVVLTEAASPMIVIEGKYKVSGKLLVLPITGEGDIKMTITSLQIKTRQKPKVEVRDGKSYLKGDLSNYKIKIKPEDMDIQLTNLFNGDKVLGDNMIKIINENWKLLWDELEPEFTQEIKKGNSKVLDAIFNNIPYEELFITDK